MTIAAIDPAHAKDHAIAIFKDEEVIFIFKSNDLTLISEHFIRFGVEQVYIEDQFFSVNPKTLKDLAHDTGKIMGVLELQQIPYELVPVVSWQSWHKIPRKPKEIKPYQWKKTHQLHLIMKAKEVSGWPVRDDDEACSILIGLYAIGAKSDS